MVNLTSFLCRRSTFNPSKDGYWRRRQILQLSAEMYGRSRHCFSIAIRAVQKSLLQSTKGRKQWKTEHSLLWQDRITSGAQELGYMPQGYPTLSEGLAQCQIHLNKQTLSNLAIWEPRTFKAINKIAAAQAHEARLPNLGPYPNGVKIRNNSDNS